MMDIAVRPQLQLVSTLLSGRKGLVIGIANENSIAWGCARVLRELGAEIAVTWLNEKARPHVQPLAEALESPIALPLDVEQPGQTEALFKVIEQKWGRLDFALHSIAYAPSQDLRGRVIDSSRDGFARAMDISCHSFVRMAHLAEPLMDRGGALLTVSFLGAAQVVPQYGVMGPVKSALESSVRYLATELGPRGIRVNALSPGPIPTRAASGIPGFDELTADARARAPLQRAITLEDVGTLSAFLVSDAAASITGDTLYVDNGFHILA